MNEKKIKEDFINSFGEEMWKQEEMLGKLVPVEINVCKLLNIEMIPVICEEMEEDSRYYIQEDYIAISPKMLLNYTDAVKSMVHELRHKYQKECCKNNYTNENKTLVNNWRMEFKRINTPLGMFEMMTNYYGLTIELDAHAYSKWYMKEKMNIMTFHPNIEYDILIDIYIKKYFEITK